MPYNRQLYYYLSFIIIYKLNKGVMFIDTTVYYSLYIIIYKLTKGVPTPHLYIYNTILQSPPSLTTPNFFYILNHYHFPNPITLPTH